VFPVRYEHYPSRVLNKRQDDGVVFLGPRANAQLVSKFHVVLHTSYATLPMATSKFLALMQPFKLRFRFKFNLKRNHPPPSHKVKLQ
jgi:hypothetical protein